MREGPLRPWRQGPRSRPRPPGSGGHGSRGWGSGSSGARSRAGGAPRRLVAHRTSCLQSGLRSWVSLTAWPLCPQLPGCYSLPISAVHPTLETMSLPAETSSERQPRIQVPPTIRSWWRCLFLLASADLQLPDSLLERRLRTANRWRRTSPAAARFDTRREGACASQRTRPRRWRPASEPARSAVPPFRLRLG